MKNKSLQQLALKKRKISTLNSQSVKGGAGGSLIPPTTSTIRTATTTSSGAQ